MRPSFFLAVCLSSLSLRAQTVAVVQEGPGDVVLFPAGDPANRTTVKLGEKPHEIELTPDGSYRLRFQLWPARGKPQRRHARNHHLCTGYPTSC